MRCPNCNKIIPDHSGRCPVCREKIMICPACGNAFSADSNFCPMDGTRLVWKEAYAEQVDGAGEADTAEYVEESAEYVDAAEYVEESAEYVGPAEYVEESAEYVDPAEYVEESAEYVDPAEYVEESAEYVDPAEYVEESAEYVDPAEYVEESAEDVDPAEDVDGTEKTSVDYEEHLKRQPTWNDDVMKRQSDWNDDGIRKQAEENVEGDQQPDQKNVGSGKKDRKKAGLTILAGIVIAAVIIGGAAWIKFHSEPGEKGKTPTADSTAKEKNVKVGSESTDEDDKKNEKHPELQAYAELLADDGDNGEMAVFDLHKDGVYEVALHDAAGNEALPDGVGILSYNKSSGVITTQFDSTIEDVGYVNEAAGQIMMVRLRGKEIDSFIQLEDDGNFSDINEFCVPYMQDPSMGTSQEDIDEYNELIDGMESPSWVDITEENIEEYLSGDGKTTGTTGEEPVSITVETGEVTEEAQEETSASSDVYSYINGDWEINGGGASDNWNLYYSINNGVIQLINRSTGEVKSNDIEYAAFNEDKTKIVIAYYAQFNDYYAGYRRFVFDISGGQPTNGEIGDYTGSNVEGDLFLEVGDGDVWQYSGGSSINRGF